MRDGQIVIRESGDNVGSQLDAMRQAGRASTPLNHGEIVAGRVGEPRYGVTVAVENAAHVGVVTIGALEPDTARAELVDGLLDVVHGEIQHGEDGQGVDRLDVYEPIAATGGRAVTEGSARSPVIP